MVTFLLLLACVLFILAAVGVKSDRLNLVAAGLAAWVATQLLGLFGR